MGDTDQEVMGEYEEVKYSPKPQDELNPAGGMIYQRMMEIYKAGEGTGEKGGVGGGLMMQQQQSIPPISTPDVPIGYTPPLVTLGKYSEENSGF